MRIVLLGAPGSGKSTQARRIAKHYNLLYIHDVVKMAKVDAGQLVSDDQIMDALKDYLQQTDVTNGFILDSFPRNIAQGEMLDAMLKELELGVDVCLKVDVDFDLIMQRLSGRYLCKDCATPYNSYTAPPRMDGCCDECGGNLHHRGEDNEEIIGSRLRIFETQTVPLLGSYQQQNKLHVIQGVGDVSVIAKAAVKILDSVARSLLVAKASVKNKQKNADKDQETEELGKNPVSGKSSVPKKAVAKKKGIVKKVAPKKAVAKKKVVTKKTAPKKVVVKKKVIAKKAAPKKAVAKKKVVAKKAAPKKTVAKKKVVAKKAAPKKTVAKKKVVAKKVAPKKTVAKKKVVAKKAAPKKAVVKKKVVAKKAALKKAVVKKKVVAKKAAPKKVVAKKKASVKKVAQKKAVSKKKVVTKKAAVRKKAKKR
ncbi:MAG: nucleoside monophosphate kinase [Gammaproteobacteria bacterium]|nr:nucleoside monophosphate kinase [Gammaproteobacteria bacterium]